MLLPMQNKLLIQCLPIAHGWYMQKQDTKKALFSSPSQVTGQVTLKAHLPFYVEIGPRSDTQGAVID